MSFRALTVGRESEGALRLRVCLDFDTGARLETFEAEEPSVAIHVVYTPWSDTRVCRYAVVAGRPPNIEDYPFMFSVWSLVPGEPYRDHLPLITPPNLQLAIDADELSVKWMTRQAAEAICEARMPVEPGGQELAAVWYPTVQSTLQRYKFDPTSFGGSFVCN